jgi:pimeloyl-ACP methyl ester carboxylesterase
MHDTRTIDLEANGLHFVAYTRGEGPLVLCLHGFPDTPHTFAAQMDALAGAGYRVVAPFMRGYAPTEIPADGVYQTAALARDVVGLIDALQVERAAVFGHDWGALAAYGAATLAPARVERLITSGVPYGPQFLAAFTTSYDQVRRSWYMYFFQHPAAPMAVAHEDFAFVRRLRADWSPGWRCPDSQMRFVCDTLARPGVLDAALGYYRCALDPTLHRPALADEQAALNFAPITIPTLYFHGAKDGCIGVETTAGMETMFPAGLTSVVIDGAGHFPHLERPEPVNDAILRFLGRRLERGGEK